MSVGAAELLPGAGGGGLDFARAASGDVAARSPLQLFWRRLRQDRVALVSLAFIVLLVVVAIAAPLVVSLLGLPGPVRAEPQPDQRLRQPAGAEPCAPVRRRPARPGRDVARDLRDARRARGGDPRHRARDRDRRRRRPARRLLSRLGRHAALAPHRRRAVDPDPAAGPGRGRRVRRAGLRVGSDPARPRGDHLHHRARQLDRTSRGSSEASCCPCARRSSSRRRARSGPPTRESCSGRSCRT